MNLTVQALIQRGFNTSLAESLQRNGYTLGKLQALSKGAFDKLGVPSDSQEALAGKRPPIPEETAFMVLHRNARTCCICHIGTRGVVIHHIDPWEQSHIYTSYGRPNEQHRSITRRLRDNKETIQVGEIEY